MARKLGERAHEDALGRLSGGVAAAAPARAPIPAPDVRRPETLQSALYRIAEKANSAEDLQELFAAIHHILGELMYARNCFIALYDPEAQMIHFPYWVDEKDPAPTPTGHRSRRFRRGLTEYILRTGRPLLLDAGELQRLIDTGEIELIGAFSNDWIGVPLKKGEQAFGVLVLQSYDLSYRYGEREKEILTFVSHEIASAIDYRRKRDALQESESKFRAVAETAPCAIFILQGARVRYANPASERITGYTPQELMTMDAWEAAHPDFHDQVKQRIAARLAGNPMGSHFELKFLTKGGEERWAEITAEAVQFEGSPAVLCTAFDVTERKHTEAALRHAEERYRSIFESVAEGIFQTTLDGGWITANPSLARTLGYATPEELMASVDPASLYVQPATRRIYRGMLEQVDHITGVEAQVRRKDGEVIWISENIQAVRGRAGELVGFVGTVQDITARKRAEEALRESQALQSALFRIAETASTAGDLQQLYGAIHRIIAELMYAPNMYIALYDSAADLISFPYFVDEREPAPGARRPSKGLTEYVLRTGQPFLSRLEKIDELVAVGSVRRIGAPSFDWMGVPLKKADEAFGVLAVQSYDENIRYGDRDKELLTFVSQHVANAIERRRNQEALKDSEARYRSLVQSAVYGIYRSSVQDRFLDVNPALVKMLGYDTAEEVLALDLARDLYVEPGERARLVQRYHATQRVESVEVKWKRKDGTPMTVRLSGRAVLNARGETEGFEMIAEDVTERRAFEEQLRQSQKMEAIGRLAGGVAHDFNNLLTVIKGYSELLLDTYAEQDPRRKDVEEIRKASDRASSLTRQLLAFSRQQVLAPRVLNLNHVVQSMEGLLRRLLGENVQLTNILASDLGHVTADPGQLEQVIMNLAINARDAMPRGGKLTIETANVFFDDLYLREHPEVTVGQYVMLAVTDTGQGMDAETKAHIFEPFFTTKDQGKGTGLGLSTVYGIVKQSGGEIWVYSEVGVGTTFKVYLPRVDAPADMVHGMRREPHSRTGHETILLVEDEDGVRSLVRKFLERAGYHVLEARGGPEALELARTHSGRLHLLLTDVVLAQMSGRDLAQKLHELRPDLKVLYMSGYTDDAIVHHGVLEASAAFLQKPFTGDTLAGKVRETLDAE